MTSRRRYPLSKAARTARGAASVAGVAAFVSALIITGRPGGIHGVTQTTAVEARGVTAAMTSDAPPPQAALSPASVREALGPLNISAAALRAAERPVRVTRSHARTAHPWVRPNHGVLTSCYCMRWGTLHPGIDLAAPYGSPIVAATDGCITFAAYDGGYGNAIKIADWDGTETLYGHMSALVKTSGCVHAGDVIGREGSTGFSTGPHLHFEVHVNGATINPIPFMTARGVKI